MDTLATVVRRNEVQTMLENARLTRDHPDGAERMETARRQVYRVLYKAALGEITEGERRQILDILRPCCPGLFSRDHQPAVRPDELLD